MPARTQEGVQAFIDAVEALGLHVTSLDPLGNPANVMLDLGGHHIAVELKYRNTLTPRDVSQLHGKSEGISVDGVQVLVADRISATAREMLNKIGIGWLDLRGHLRMTGTGIFIDAEVPAETTRPERSEPFSGTAGVEIACSLLLRPDEAPGVRKLARELGRSPSTVSEILQLLRDQRLIDHSGRPVVPDLFWEIVKPWRTQPIALAQYPHPTGDSRLASALQLGLEKVETTTGWALTDTLAAVEYNAPIAAGSAYPPDFYVPTNSIARRAVQVFGEASEWNSRRATVRVAPISAACAARVDGRRTWPLAQPLFVALDLASDPERGREILEGWTPPRRWPRVW